MKHQTASEDRIPPKDLFGLILGGLGVPAAMLVTNQIGTFVWVFTLHVSPWILSLVGAIGGIFGLFIGPFIGQLCDSFRSRWGRRHPMIVITGVPTVLLAGLTFFVPPGLSEVGIAFWALTFGVLSGTLSGFYLTSVAALGVEATTDYHERTRLARFMGLFNLGVGFLPLAIFPAAKLPIFGNTMNGVHVIVGTLTVLFLLFSFAPLLCNEKRYASLAHGPSPSRKVIANIKEAVFNMGDVTKNRPFVVIVIINTIIFFCYSIVGGLGAFMNTYYVFGGNVDKAAPVYGLLGACYLIAGALAVGFLFPYISRRCPAMHSWREQGSEPRLPRSAVGGSAETPTEMLSSST